MLASPLRRCAALCLLGAVACSGGPREDAARMQSAVEPYLDDVAAYDRWARRLSLADAAFRSDAALEEAAFAPLRDEPRVVAAWLEREGPDPRTLAHPPGAPALPSSGWVRIRTAELGELDAQHATLAIGGEDRELLLIRRSAPAPGGATLHVTLAF